MSVKIKVQFQSKEMKTDSNGVHDKKWGSWTSKNRQRAFIKTTENTMVQETSRVANKLLGIQLLLTLEVWKTKKIKLDPIQCPVKRKEKTFLLLWFNLFVSVVQIKTVLMYSSACVTSNDSNIKEKFFHQVAFVIWEYISKN